MPYNNVEQLGAGGMGESGDDELIMVVSNWLALSKQQAPGQ